MITGTILKNGTIRLILTGSDEIDAAILKQLNGATARLITDNVRLEDKLLTGAIILEKIEINARQITEPPAEVA